MKNQKRAKLFKRKKSIRKNLKGSAERPRVSIFRSAKHIYAQIIDDYAMNTLASFSDVRLGTKAKGTNVEKAQLVGEELGKMAKAKKINKVVFDRSGYKFHGRVKALADGIRKAGINF